MPGPVPKDPKIRSRRNTASTRAKFIDDGTARPEGVPELPGHETWHALTQAWWADVWASPMAEEYLRVDVHGLYRLAMLVNRFWILGDPSLAGEIRLSGQLFGLTPIDRRRLQWEVAKVEDRERDREPQPPSAPVDDPRELLRVVDTAHSKRRRSGNAPRRVRAKP